MFPSPLRFHVCSHSLNTPKWHFLDEITINNGYFVNDFCQNSCSFPLSPINHVRPTVQGGGRICSIYTPGFWLSFYLFSGVYILHEKSCYSPPPLWEVMFFSPSRAKLEAFFVPKKGGSGGIAPPIFFFENYR